MLLTVQVGDVTDDFDQQIGFSSVSYKWLEKPCNCLIARRVGTSEDLAMAFGYEKA